MQSAAVVCFAVACLAELAGVVLIVREAVNAGRALREWGQADNPENDGQGTYAQQLLVNQVVRTLLGARAGATWGVVLLVGGIITGTVGNFLTL